MVGRGVSQAQPYPGLGSLGAWAPRGAGTWAFLRSPWLLLWGVKGLGPGHLLLQGSPSHRPQLGVDPTSPCSLSVPLPGLAPASQTPFRAYRGAQAGPVLLPVPPSALGDPE